MFKVKAGTLLEKSSPWTVSLHQDPDAASLTTQLIECLDHIQDETFVTEKCIQATQPTFEEMFELVSYARKRVCSVSQCCIVHFDFMKVLQLGHTHAAP